jgi:hypothetical protein
MPLVIKDAQGGTHLKVNPTESHCDQTIAEDKHAHEGELTCRLCQVLATSEEFFSAEGATHDERV